MRTRLRVIPAMLLFTLALAFSPFAAAQEKPLPPGQQGAEETHEPAIGWNIANFVILVAILAYLIRKSGAPFFRTRAENIEKSLTEGDRARREGEARVAEMEQRIANLGTEIERLRAHMRQDLAAEGERIRMETERHLRRIQEQAEQEIDSMHKTARRQLKMYAAELAIRSAEEQLKGRITRDVENSLVTSFIDDLRASDGGRSSRN